MTMSGSPSPSMSPTSMVVWPVIYTIIDVTAKVTYPDLRVSLPSEPHRIVPYVRTEGEEDE